MNNNELKHYGVLGMKWGRRKGRIVSEDSANTAKIRKKKIREMSNQELRTANDRLTLERNYKSLTKRPNNTKKVINGFIKTAGTVTAIVAAAGTYKKFGNKIVDKIGDRLIKDFNS